MLIDGDTIYLPPGTYTFPSPIRFYGRQQMNIVGVSEEEFQQRVDSLLQEAKSPAAAATQDKV